MAQTELTAYSREGSTFQRRSRLPRPFRRPWPRMAFCLRMRSVAPSRGEEKASMQRVFPIGWRVLVSAAVLVAGCNLVPSRPDAVFTVYRERMKSDKIEEARELLVEESRTLAKTLESTHKLKQTPEDLALLNALDPVTAPSIAEATDTVAVLQVRTMKGGSRLVRLVRKDVKSPWQVDLSKELTSLHSFLETRRALEMLREQAGEYASTWKAFNDRLDQVVQPEPAPMKPVQPHKAAKSPPKQQKAPAKKPQKKSANHHKKEP
jgi:hypothetical protein